MKQNHMNQMCTFSCGEWSNKATTVRVREYSIEWNLHSYTRLSVDKFHPCLFLRLWDKLSQALSRSGGNRMLEETEKHVWVLPLHPCVWIQDQGQQLQYVRSSSGPTIDSSIEKQPWTRVSFTVLQVQRMRHSFSPKVTRQKTTREARLTRHCQIAPPRQTLECGHLKKRTREEVTTTVMPTRPLSERWELAGTNQIQDIPNTTPVRIVNPLHVLSVFQVSTLPHRTRGCSMPISFLQEKIEELHIYKDKSREPDWAHFLQTVPQMTFLLSECHYIYVVLFSTFVVTFFLIWFCCFFIFTYLGLAHTFSNSCLWRQPFDSRASALVLWCYNKILQKVSPQCLKKTGIHPFTQACVLLKLGHIMQGRRVTLTST